MQPGEPDDLLPLLLEIYEDYVAGTSRRATKNLTLSCTRRTSAAGPDS
jgi:hypothetical protein